MSTRKQANPTLAVYLDNLLIQLRLLEVPGARIGEILAEVETYVADKGQDPVTAFGAPGEYAATYVAVSGSAPARNLLRDLGVAMVSGMAGAAAVEGAVHLFGSAGITVRTFGQWLAVGVVGMALFHVFGRQLARDTAHGLKPRKLTSRTMVLGGLAYLCALATLLLIPLVLPGGPTLVSVPGWVLFVAGLLAFSALVRHLGGDRVTDPRE